MFESISVETFTRRTGITPNFSMRASKIVSMRDLAHGSITGVQVMPKDYLRKLLHSVTLEGDTNHRPYKDCDIKLVRIDPNDLAVGQTFVQRSKYQDFLEEFSSILDESFCVTRGAAKCNALIVFGRTQSGEDVVAHYLPPIIEATNGTQFLLDGIHRNFLVKQIGTTIESIIVKGVSAPLPCTAKNWSDIHIVNEKPPRDQRFHNLQPSLFRNLKWIGVDG